MAAIRQLVHLGVLVGGNMEIKRGSNSLGDMILKVKELQSQEGRVGWFSAAKYENGTPVAEIAAQNEFGNTSKKIPPRPTIRPAITENKSKWEQMAALGANAILAGKASAKTVMTAITLDAENAISKNIATITEPKLAPYTLEMRRAKGNNSTKPLVDTGLELATLTSMVLDANS